MFMLPLSSRALLHMISHAGLGKCWSIVPAQGHDVCMVARAGPTAHTILVLQDGGQRQAALHRQHLAVPIERTVHSQEKA